MAHVYSVILATLASDGGDVWERPREVLETIAAAGYQGVDLDAEPDRIGAARFREVVDLAQSLGLRIPALVGAWGGWHAGEERDLASPDQARRTYAVDYAKSCVDLAATFDDPPILEICAAAFQPEYPESSVPRADLRRAFVTSAREISAYAARVGVDIAVEPINRFEGHAGFLNSLAEATDVVEEVGASNLGVLADLFHVNIEDGPLSDALRAAGRRLAHVHLADSNRRMPGSGHLDFFELIRTLNSIDFDGYLSLDCIPPRPDWKTQVRASIDYMRRVERLVEIQDELTGLS